MMTLGKRTFVASFFLITFSLIRPLGLLAEVSSDGFEELSRGADYICIAKVKSIESAWGANSMGDRLIYSTVRLDVLESIKGSLGKETEIVNIGGKIGDIVSRASFAPVFLENETVFLFLKNYGGKIHPYQFSGGKYHIDDQGMIPAIGISAEILNEQIRKITINTYPEVRATDKQGLEAHDPEENRASSSGEAGGCNYHIGIPK